MPNVLSVVAASLVYTSLLFVTGTPRDAATHVSGRTRSYFIAADEVMWDYAPSGTNQITGQPFDAIDQTWTKRGPHRIGTVYQKALYREYSDSTFRTLKPRPAAWAHLGSLGPLIRAEVGDTIRIVFRNNGHHPYSMHPHGVFYRKDSEGALYSDGTPGALARGDAVAPGGTRTYVWLVPERAGPGEGDASSVLWMYHSHVNEGRDVNAGLVGPIIVTRRGMAREDGSPSDVNREFVVAFAETNENVSWYIDDNIRSFVGDPTSVRRVIGFPFLDPFGLSNVKQSMNGFIYGNGPMPTMRIGEHVRWYLMATTNAELHAPHWHGNVVVSQHMRTDVLTLATMGMLVADMVPDNPGIWLFHCHVEPHLRGGMQMRFQVTDSAAAVQ
jgi:hephaestin